VNHRQFRAGDRVLVRSPEEILSTLDSNGTLDSFPFMPEMLDSCGKVFQIQRRVEKICAPDLPLQRYPADDVGILDGLRCDRIRDAGCKMAAVLWKEAWLRPFDPAAPTRQISQARLEELRARLKVKADDHHYLCQSTERLKATEPFAGKQTLWMVRIALREIRNGDLPASRVLKLFALWFWQRILRAAGCDDWLRGPHQRTPTRSLHLEPGELVRIKTRAQIVYAGWQSCHRVWHLL
jgi:hypothetical protein